MSQETSAQKRQPRGNRTEAVKTAAVVPDISYVVSMPKPSNHLLQVEIRVKWAQLPDKTELKMPVWTPGSYLVREYARHVQDFTVKNAAGSGLPWSKTNKNTWQVETKGEKEIVVAYSVYANELTVRTNELNDEHAFWNNAALLLFIKGQLAAPSLVRVQPFGNWKVATGLPPVAGQTNTFRAENYDILYDSPFEVSDYKEIKFTVLGKPHRYVVTGEGNYDLQRMADDTTKIIEEASKIFGDLPYNDYTFIVNLRGGGGLEHLNSTALQFNRWGFKPDSRYKSFLGLVAHEYFHVWNVKRIKPDVLGPFDYENENYTRLLWVAEGATAYYEGILMRRAGLISDKEFLNTKVAQITQLQEKPGRLEMSLEEASFDAWIKYYRPDENAINSQVSYYDKGEIVNMLLDITIRTSSAGAKSLDDVMRYLYNEYAKKGRNYTPEDFQKAAEMAAGKSLDEFFAKYVRGTDEIDYASIFRGIGIEFGASNTGPGRSYIGANMADEAGRLMIRTVPAGTPAYEQGLNTGDQIVAVDGNRASLTFLSGYINERKPGDTVKLTVFRHDRLREIPFVLGEDDSPSYELSTVAEPTPEQQKLYQQYLQAEL